MFGGPGRTRYLSVSHANVFRVKIPPAPGGRRKDPGALIKTRPPEQGHACGAAGLAVCPAQLAQPPCKYREMPAHPGAPSFLAFSPGWCNESQGKAGKPWGQLASPHAWPEICPGQRAHVNSSAVAPSGGLPHNTEK